MEWSGHEEVHEGNDRQCSGSHDTGERLSDADLVSLNGGQLVRQQ